MAAEFVNAINHCTASMPAADPGKASAPAKTRYLHAKTLQSNYQELVRVQGAVHVQLTQLMFPNNCTDPFLACPSCSRVPDTCSHGTSYVHCTALARAMCALAAMMHLHAGSAA